MHTYIDYSFKHLSPTMYVVIGNSETVPSRVTAVKSANSSASAIKSAGLVVVSIVLRQVCEVIKLLLLFFPYSILLLLHNIAQSHSVAQTHII